MHRGVSFKGWIKSKESIRNLSGMVYAGGRFGPVLYKHRIMRHYIKREDMRYYLRTTKADIAFQKRLLKYIVYGLPFFTFWFIMCINFLFWLFRG